MITLLLILLLKGIAVDAGPDQTVPPNVTVTLTGTVVLNNPGKGFSVQWSFVSGPPMAGVSFATPNQPVTTATFSPIPGNYTVSLTARSQGVQSVSTATITVLPPAAARLAWDLDKSESLIGYNVYRRDYVPSGNYTTPLNTNGPFGALTYTDATVQNGKSYYYVVRAVGVNGSESPNSNEVLATFP